MATLFKIYLIQFFCCHLLNPQDIPAIITVVTGAAVVVVVTAMEETGVMTVSETSAIKDLVAVQ